MTRADIERLAVDLCLVGIEAIVSPWGKSQEVY